MKSRLAIGLLVLFALAACGRHRKSARYPNGYYDPNSGMAMTQPSATVGAPPSASVTAPTAPAELTDSDRAAARDLYNAGVALQQQGKAADALDKFQRSVSVLRAPTTQLHVAQCKVALAHLVEGAEDYRAIMNTTLPGNSPPAFLDAQKMAGQELAALEPRVPHAKIVVTPDKTPGLQIAIDGQPVNTALVGVSRPVNPGTHKIVASAPGMLPTEQSFDIKEREAKEIPLALKK